MSKRGCGNLENDNEDECACSPHTPDWRALEKQSRQRQAIRLEHKRYIERTRKDAVGTSASRLTAQQWLYDTVDFHRVPCANHRRRTQGQLRQRSSSCRGHDGHPQGEPNRIHPGGWIADHYCGRRSSLPVQAIQAVAKR